MSVKIRESYDWVVLGTHPGALLSAGWAAKLGLSVLVLPLGPVAKPVVTTHAGWIWDPESSWLLGVGRPHSGFGLLGDDLGKLGILPSERERFQEVPHGIQSLSPEHRVEFSGDTESFVREWNREFGGGSSEKFGIPAWIEHSEAQVLSFWKDLPSRLTVVAGKAPLPIDPSSIDQLEKSLRKSWGERKGSGTLWPESGLSIEEFAHRLARPDLFPILRGLALAINGLKSLKPDIADLWKLLPWVRSSTRFMGGMSAYRDFLMLMAKRLGAHFPEGTDCQRIFVERGKLVGVQLAHKGNVVQAGGAIVGTSLDHAAGVFSENTVGGLLRSKRKLAPQGWIYTLGICVDSKALPPGMGARLVWCELDAMPVELEVIRASADGSSSNRVSLFARTVLPFSQETLEPAYLEQISAKLFRLVSQIIPFLELHVEALFPDFRSSDRLDYQVAYPFSKIDQVPESLRCYGGTGTMPRTAIDGLFVSSSEVYPEMGSLGGVVAALESTAWIAHRRGLPGPWA